VPKKTLGKAVFAECLIKYTRQNFRHSAKGRFPVVICPTIVSFVSIHIGTATPAQIMIFTNLDLVLSRKPGGRVASGLAFLSPSTLGFVNSLSQWDGEGM